MQGKIEIKNGAYTEYVSILISILTPQCALQGDREPALRVRLTAMRIAMLQCIHGIKGTFHFIVQGCSKKILDDE